MGEVTMGIWDKYENIYEKLWVQKVSLGPTRKGILNVLGKLEGIRSLLDMGCGTGQLLEEIQEQYQDLQLMGVEPSAMANKVGERGIPIKKASIATLRGRTLYDVIVCTHSFPYYGQKEIAIHKLATMTNEGGYLLIANAITDTWYDKVGLFFVKLTTSKAMYPSEVQMRQYLEEDYEVVEVIKINKWYIPTIKLFVARKKGI